MTKNQPIQDRVVFRISGSDAEDFLQNLVTNDITRDSAGIVYTALLTPQGKLIADFFVIADDPGLLVDCAGDVADDLQRRFTLYKLRADVQIERTDLKVFCGTGPAPADALADPRDRRLGWRQYGEVGGEDGSDWTALYVAATVPRWGIELDGESYILEMGFERLNGVDFKKGCYVGQEVTARMKHKSTLRKGLAQVRVDRPVAIGTPITREGKPVGTLFSQSGALALAYLRHDRAGPGMRAGEAHVTLAASEDG